MAGCLHGGVTTLYSEDFGTRADLDGVQILNPFQ